MSVPRTARSRSPYTTRIRLDGGEELPGLLDRHLGRPALPVRVAHPPDRLKGIEHRPRAGPPGYRRSGAVPARAWFWVGAAPGSSSRNRPARPGVTWCSSSPWSSHQVEEPAHLVGVGGPRVGVGDRGGEELVRGEAGRLAGPHEDGREGPLEVLFAGESSVFEDEFLVSVIISYV